MTNELKQEVTTKQLDEAVQKLWTLRQDYEEKKRISSEANALAEQAEHDVLELLEKADKKNYQLDGVAKVIAVTKLQVNTPKDLEQKAAFFKWLKDNYGADGFLAYLNINHNSLNNLWNIEFEKSDDKVGFSIAGIDQPVERKTLRVNKL
jgi:hypothetical protein